MYTGYLSIEEANRRVREAHQKAEAHRLAKQARQAQTVPTTKRESPRMRFLFTVLRRKPKYGNAGPEMAAGVQDQSGTLPLISTG
jgi:hypothetical protein